MYIEYKESECMMVVVFEKIETIKKNKEKLIF